MEIKIAFQKPYIYWLIGIFLLYFSLNIFLSKFYITVQYLPYYLDSIDWLLLLLSFIFSVSIAFLVALNMILGYHVYKERKKTSASLTALGAVGGMSTGICTACVGSVFPALFGITLSFSALPFKGAEVQALFIIFLGVNLYFLKNPIFSLRSKGIFNEKKKTKTGEKSP